MHRKRRRYNATTSDDPIVESTTTKKAGTNNRKPRVGRTSTIKTSLKRYLVAPDITLPVIEDAVKYISVVSRAASKAINVALLDLLEQHDGVLPYFIDFDSHTQFYQIFSVVRGGAAKITKDKVRPFTLQVIEACHHYADVLPILKSLPFDSCLLAEASKQYMTVFQNHHVVAMEQRMVTYIKLRLGEDRWKQLRQRKAAFQLLRYIRNDGDCPEHAALNDQHEWLNDLRRRFIEYDAARRGITDTSTSFKSAVEMTYFLGLKVEEWKLRRQLEDEALADSDHQTPASFSIAPICEVKQHFIVVTQTTLEKFFRGTLAGKLNDLIVSDDLKKVVDAKPDSEDARSGWWKAVFKDDMFKHRSLRKGWNFDGRVLTDGVSLCVAFRQGDQKVCTKTRFKKKCECYGCSKMDFDPAWQFDRVCSNDPGHDNIAYVVERDPRGKVHSHVLRNHDFYKSSNMFKRTKILQKHQKRSSAVFAALSRTCKKTVDLCRQLEYWRFCLANEEVIMKRLYIKVRARLAFEVYSKRMSSMDSFWSSVKHARKGKLVMLYGSGGGSRLCYKGGKSAPTSFPYKRCRKVMEMMFVVPEPYTSQYCPDCNCKVADVTQDCIDSRGVRRQKVIRSVKRCSSSVCVEGAKKNRSARVRDLAVRLNVCEWVRDKLGALNIEKCGVAMMRGEERPEHLTFAYNRLQ